MGLAYIYIKYYKLIKHFKGEQWNKPELAGTFRDDNWQPKDIENVAHGRFPANIIFECICGDTEQHTNPECPCYMLDQQSGVSKSTIGNPRGTYKKGLFANSKFNKVGTEHNDKGGASRFFYTAKASKNERNAGCDGSDGTVIKESIKHQNNHPTVKPIDLMKYLVKLVSREGGIVLDPFMGSGTTGIACVLLNRNYIGFDKTEEYIKIAETRIDYWSKSEQKREVIKEKKEIMEQVIKIKEQKTLERWEWYDIHGWRYAQRYARTLQR